MCSGRHPRGGGGGGRKVTGQLKIYIIVDKHKCQLFKEAIVTHVGAKKYIQVS